jgi:hypothetical protein
MFVWDLVVVIGNYAFDSFQGASTASRRPLPVNDSPSPSASVDLMCLTKDGTLLEVGEIESSSGRDRPHTNESETETALPRKRPRRERRCAASCRVISRPQSSSVRDQLVREMLSLSAIDSAASAFLTVPLATTQLLSVSPLPIRSSLIRALRASETLSECRHLHSS